MMESGRNPAFQSIALARIVKSWIFHFRADIARAVLSHEIKSKRKAASKRERSFAVRLNGTSDIDHSETIRDFPSVSFYDYTKRIDRNFDKCKNELNYHLTLSAGSLFDTLGTAIKYRLNYAGVLNVKRNAVLPSHIEINGIKFPVIDGDITDWRIGDNNDTTNIVGLRVKRTPNQTEEMRKAFCIA